MEDELRPSDEYRRNHFQVVVGRGKHGFAVLEITTNGYQWQSVALDTIEEVRKVFGVLGKFLQENGE